MQEVFSKVVGEVTPLGHFGEFLQGEFLHLGNEEELYSVEHLVRVAIGIDLLGPVLIGEAQVVVVDLGPHFDLNSLVVPDPN